LDNEIRVAHNKYNDFKNNEGIQNNVNNCIKGIYNKKLDQTKKKYKDIALNNKIFT
jgi:hypothetical protein